MQPMFGLSVFLSEASIVPVELYNATGGELVGLVASSVTCTKSLNGAALSSFTPTAWNELGHGLYALTVPASTLSAEGAFVYRVETNPAGTNPAFNGFARIEHRLDQYECKISVQYNEVTSAFSALVWLVKNGQTVPQAGVASCQIWITDTAASVPVNLTSVSPNADGVFVMTQSAIVLALNMNYACKISILDAAGTTWISNEAAITFN